MSFINGLKKFFKKPIYVLILSLFIVAWILILFGYTIFPIQGYYRFLFFLIGVLVGFTFLLFFITFFKPIDKINYLIIIIIFLMSIPLLLIFKGLLRVITPPFLITNQLLIAFFAFKLCIDSSTKVDDYFYNNKKSRNFTRPLEFVIFGIIYLSIFIITWNIMRRLTPAAAKRSANVFRIIFWVNIILLTITITRVLIKKRLAAYITLFFLLTYFYILYIFIDVISETLFPETFAWYIFIIDLLLFFYIIGSIFDKVEYLEKKFKILRAETISLFAILLKLIAQFFKIIPDIPGIRFDIDFMVWLLQLILLWVFIAFILIFGIHSIIVHREGRRESNELEKSNFTS